MDWPLGTDQSLQDMLDCDIKSEIDSVIGGHPELGFNFTELSPLDLDDDPASSKDNLNSWFGSRNLFNGNSNSSNSNFNLDLSGCDAASIMVNPKSVMPHMSVPSSIKKNLLNNTTNSITHSKRNFTFSTKIESKKERIEDPVNHQYKEVESVPDNKKCCENIVLYSEGEEDSEDSKISIEQECSSAIKIAMPISNAKTTLLVPTDTIKTLSPQMTKIKQQLLQANSITGFQLQNLKILESSRNSQIIKNQICINNVISSKQAPQLMQLSTTIPNNICPKSNKYVDPLNHHCNKKPYPKPAYSYSCLIAMALKNSHSGSLPVSEIYNFMCQHFPYFKTAPSGWKNSVRHNLSLNKCFEKIEKPTGNSNQRKGCLWAINPTKIEKMNEEVRKWSRKDPLAIKKAMIYPDQLDLLERGEMKYISSNNGDLVEETDTSSDEVDDTELSVHPANSATLRHSYLAANSVTDSYDESSQDCDIDMSEQLYDEIDIDDNKDALHMQLNISSQENKLSDYQISTSIKRQKTATNTLQANYVYQPVITVRRKTPLFLTHSAAGSILKIE